MPAKFKRCLNVPGAELRLPVLLLPDPPMEVGLHLLLQPPRHRRLLPRLPAAGHGPPALLPHRGAAAAGLPPSVAGAGAQQL